MCFGDSFCKIFLYDLIELGLWCTQPVVLFNPNLTVGWVGKVLRVLEIVFVRSNRVRVKR